MMSWIALVSGAVTVLVGQWLIAKLRWKNARRTEENEQ